MNKLKIFAASAIAAMGLSACNEEVNNSFVTVRFSAESSVDDGTKASLTPMDDKTFVSAWDNGDVLRVDYKNDKGSGTVLAKWNDSSKSFEATLPECVGCWEYNAVYPASGTSDDLGWGFARIQKGNSYNSKYDLMKGGASAENAKAGKTSDGKDIVFKMDRQTAIIYFHLKSELDEEVISATLKMDKPIASDNAGMEMCKDEITITFKEGTAPRASDFCIWYNILPVESSFMSIHIETEGHTLDITHNSDTSFVPGKLYKTVLNEPQWVKKADSPATLSQTENILISQPWKPYDLIYYGGEGETYWEWNTEIPASAEDDRLTFHKDGKFELNLGANTKIFNDMGERGIHHEKIVPTGEEKWSYEKEGEAEFIVFSNGGFPGMLADNDGINGKYEIRNVTANRFELHYYQAAQGQSLCFVYVSENYVEESGDPELSKENVEKTLSGKTFEVSAFGWCDYGDNAWEYFKDPVPETTAEDRITFNADGTLVIDLGEDLTIYHDNGWRTIEKGWFEDEKWIIAGGETWAVKSDPTGVFVKFDNGGFPLMLASSNIEGPEYNLGLDGQWTVASIKEDGTIRLEIYQNFNKQWFTVFLSPVE